MRDVKARGDTLLFHSGHVGFRDRALGAFSDEGLKLRLTLCKALREGMLSGDRHKGHTHHRVGTGRVHSKAKFTPILLPIQCSCMRRTCSGQPSSCLRSSRSSWAYWVMPK